MGFREVNIKEMTEYAGLNAIMVVTNGLCHLKELPDFGKTTITLTNADGKVMYIEEETKIKTKL